MKKLRFNLDCLPFRRRGKKNTSKSFRQGVKRGSDGLVTFGRSLRSGVTWSVFPEDLRVSEKKVFDPQDKNLLYWNKFFELLCIFSVACDPFLFYLPYFNHKSFCLAIDNKLASFAVTLRTIFDCIYLVRISFQFRTAYIAPSSRVFGRGELVIDPAQIAKRYLQRYFIVDFISVLPMPQIIVWKYLYKTRRAEVLATKTALLRIVILQYFPRFLRFLPLASEVKKTAGVFSENALLGAMYYLIWYMLASHITGSVWYLLAIERNDTCWKEACKEVRNCYIHFLYCGSSNKHIPGYESWRNISETVLKSRCSGEEDSQFNYGIFTQAIQSGIVASIEVFPKFCYCLWWGLQNLSTLGQGLQTSTYPGEVLFSIVIAIMGLILFALLIGNMQTYLQSMSVRLEEMRIKRRDSEQWMHHRLLPPELRERVRKYDQYKWLNTRGVDEENLVQSLPKDLRRDIKRHLCLNLVRRVPLFANMEERLLDAICERLKPSLYTESTYIVREGDPVNEMLFIIRGRLESVTTDGGRSGFFNRGLLKEGDFCGEELLTWALDPKSAANLPSSTRTVKAINEVEAFALEAEELKFVASQFRHIHSRQVQHTFRFYSQQWRTWAAIFIQAAWRRHMRRKLAEQRRKEEEEDFYDSDDGGNDSARALVPHSEGSSSRGFGLGSTIYASRFAANLQGRRLRGSSSMDLAKIQKPSEPDFSALDDEE
ncbi:putative IQ motif, EF-hand binding, potassium channel, voltage-dependent, EAG/ELK/ERG [Lupinus albus]|uniref:Putative IQ motif, EF-hand binding, potassium channel, voltage-dependent, EAG/ELK/ERG n=1 Tax=Lupinus albus TaxID=3870 RepID=A0A6A4R5E4_LUPAL|nr:putative IQ motif, EF-hand binding, potassium channel, voltage-dependent, EAG/ELK/ERG [Lupinus albus]